MNHARSLTLIALTFFSSLGLAQPRFTEVYRFKVEINQQACTRADGEDYVCGEDGGRSLIEVPLERVNPDALEDEAFEGASEPLGLSLSASLQYLPQVTVRKSIVAGTSIYTVRFRARRAEDGAPAYETVYIEDGAELELSRRLTLMADRFGNSPRFFRQVFITLDKI